MKEKSINTYKSKLNIFYKQVEEYIRLRKFEKIADQLGQFENFFSASDLKKMREDK
jgi:hypothetical protein